MNFSEFKALPLEEQIELLSNRLNEVKNEKGRLDSKFKNEIFEFDYSNLRKDPNKLGYQIKNYQVHRLDGEPIVVNEKPNTKKTNVIEKLKDVKDTKNVKQKQEVVNSEEVKLSSEEILFVKELFKEKQASVNQQQLFMPVMIGEKRSTGISIYADVLDRWNEFKKEYSVYSGSDLMTLALEEFMDKYSKK